MKDWADEVRLTGNDALHPLSFLENTDDEVVSKEDAEDIIQLLEQFIEVLYITPALAQDRKTKREQGKAKTQPSSGVQ